MKNVAHLKLEEQEEGNDELAWSEEEKGDDSEILIEERVLSKHRKVRTTLWPRVLAPSISSFNGGRLMADIAFITALRQVCRRPCRGNAQWNLEKAKINAKKKQEQ